MVRNYVDMPELGDLYLEDSYVVGIFEDSSEVRFSLEAVVRPGSPYYRDPRPGEQYCYRNGDLVFGNIRNVHWITRSPHAYRDATGTEDLGNIDCLIERNGVYDVEGDWGRVEITSARDPRFEIAAEQD